MPALTTLSQSLHLSLKIKTMWPSLKLVPLPLSIVAVASWQDHPAGRALGVTHESFCLSSAAVTKKPLARLRPSYDSEASLLSLSTIWTHPTQVVAFAIKAWVRQRWEHVLDYQNLLREDECPITREYDWRLVDYNVEPRGRAWHDFQELSQAMREGGREAMPSVGRTRQACNFLLDWVRQQLDTAVASILEGVNQLLVMLCGRILEAAWAFVSGVMGWTGGWIMAIVGGTLHGVFQIIQALWIMSIALLRLRYQFVVLALVAAWNLIAGTVLAVWGFLASLMQDVLRGSIHHLVEAEDTLVTALGGSMSTACNTVVRWGMILQNAVVGGFTRVGGAVAAEITDVRNLVMGTWVMTKAFVAAVQQSIISIIWQAQQSVVQAGAHFATSVRHSIENVRKSTLRAAQSIVPSMPTAWIRTWWRMISLTDAALPWIIAAVSCAFGCYMWWWARRAVATTPALTTKLDVGDGGGVAGLERIEGEIEEENQGGKEEAIGEPQAMATIRHAPLPSPVQVPAREPAGEVMERPPAAEEKKDEEETEEEKEEWLLFSRHRQRQVERPIPGERACPSSPVRVQDREETATMAAARSVQTGEVRLETEEAATVFSLPPPSFPTLAAPLPPPLLKPPHPSPAPSKPTLIPLCVALPFICAVLGVEHPDTAIMRASMGPKRWDDFLTLYRQDFADRGLDTDVEVAKLKRRPDGRCTLPDYDIRYMLYPPESDVSPYEFLEFCTAAEAANIVWERWRKLEAEAEDAPTVGGEEVGQA